MMHARNSTAAACESVPPDALLVERIAALSDKTALAELDARHGVTLYAIAYSLLFDPAGADAAGDGSYVCRSSVGLPSAAAPASSGKPAAARSAVSFARAGAGSRSSGVGRGPVLNTCARSTTAWRAMANVSRAWRAHPPSAATITSALASSTVVSAPSHDWLLCCERKNASIG